MRIKTGWNHKVWSRNHDFWCVHRAPRRHLTFLVRQSLELIFLVRQKPGVVPISSNLEVWHGDTHKNLWDRTPCWSRKTTDATDVCLLTCLLSTRHLQILHAIRYVGHIHIVMSLGRATRSIHSPHIHGIFAMAQVAAMAGSTRKIHVLHGAVHVVVDHGSTAGDL